MNNGGFAPSETSIVTDNGIRVEVKIRDEAVRIYDSKQTEAGTMGWIESIEGERFVIKVRDAQQDRREAMKVLLSVDGIQVEHLVLRPGYDSIVFRGCSIADLQVQPFVFSRVNVTEQEDEANATDNVLAGIGSIRLDVLRAKLIRRKGSKTGYVAPTEILLEEKDKKATIPHQTKFGAAVDDEAVTWVNLNLIDSEDSPFASIILKYRSRAVLEMDGRVAPRVAPNPRGPNPRGMSGNSMQAIPSSRATPGNNKRETVDLTNDDSDEDEDLATSEAEVARLRAETAELEKNAEIAKIRLEIKEREVKLAKSKSRKSKKAKIAAQKENSQGAE